LNYLGFSSGVLSRVRARLSLFIVLISIISGICASSKHFPDESSDDAKLSSKHFTGISTDDTADDKKQTLHSLFGDGIGRFGCN